MAKLNIYKNGTRILTETYGLGISYVDAQPVKVIELEDLTPEQAKEIRKNIKDDKTVNKYKRLDKGKK